MSSEQIARNPEVDYTRYPTPSQIPQSLSQPISFIRPDLISLVFSDVGILTPEAISQYLVAMFAG